MKTDISVDGFHFFRPKTWIKAEGEDAHGFLQSQFSNDLNRLEAGQTVYGLWLNQKGKVHGDSFVFREAEETFFLMSYSTEEEVILNKLNSFIVADDVRLEGLAEKVSGVTLLGKAVELVEVLGLSNGKSGTCTLEAGRVVAIPGRRGIPDSMDLICWEVSRDVLLSTLKDKRSDLNGFGIEAMEVLRIRSLCPLIPLDIGPGELPQEGRLGNDAISFTKGCYLGQEVMSRLHSMGRTRRSLRLCRSECRAEYGAEVYCESKRVGIVKSSVLSDDGFLSLVLLNSTVQSGMVLEVKTGDGFKSLELLDSTNG